VASPLAAVLMMPLLWDELPTRRQTGATVDAPGAALIAIAATGAVLALQWATLGPGPATIGLLALATAAPVAVLRSRRHPDGIVQAALIADPGARRSLLTAVSLPSAWFGMLVAIPTSLTAHGWTGVQIGLLLVPCAALGIVAPRVNGPALVRLGPVRSQLIATLGTALALVLAGCGLALVSGPVLVVATLALMLSFGLGQPAMTTLVADSVPVQTRGGALGLMTLVFLIGGSLGAATVGGLSAQIGLTGALLTVVALPLAAAVAFTPSVLTRR